MVKKTPAKAAAPKTKKPRVKKAPPRKGPLARVKELYGGKDKLVDQIAGSLTSDDSDEDSVKDRLLKASNQQLLRLAGVVEAVKKAYGSRDQLIAALAKAVNKAKDNDYVAKLGRFSLPRLYDLARSVERRARKS